MCGARAVLVMKDGKAVDEKALADAFKGQGMKLESVTKERRSRPAVAYTFPTKGLG